MTPSQDIGERELGLWNYLLGGVVFGAVLGAGLWLLGLAPLAWALPLAVGGMAGSGYYYARARHGRRQTGR